MSRLFEKVYIESMDNEPVDDVLSFTKNYFKQHFLNKTFKTKEGRNIKITEKGFNELFFSISEAMRGGDRGAAKVYKERANDSDYFNDVLSVVLKLDKIINEMDYEYQKANYKPQRKPDVKKYVTFSCDIDLDGETDEAWIRIEVPHRGEPRFYFHYL